MPQSIQPKTRQFFRSYRYSLDCLLSVASLLAAIPALVTGCGPPPVASVSIISSDLDSFRNPDGKRFQEVISTWTNTGSTPIRVLDADIVTYTRDGTPITSVNYTIYDASDDEAGIAPGEIYTDPYGHGFKLPVISTAVSVDVTATRALEYSGM